MALPRGTAYVYFIQAEHGGPIKIGVAKNPEARVLELQTGNPYRLVIRHTEMVADAYRAERSLHRIFAEHRTYGEWFEPVPALANIARAIPGEGPEAVDYTGVRVQPWETGHTPQIETLEEYAARSARYQRLYAEWEADCEAGRVAPEEAAWRVDLDRHTSWDRRQEPITALPDDFDHQEQRWSSAA